jgi:tetratricopeptide (TPR) repeat protein
MYRDQTEYALAEGKFDLALDCCELEQERARVYSEKALLVYRKDRDANTAEEWFRKAVSADKLNKQVFLSWAEFYEELGNYRSALEKVNHVLGQLDGDDEEAQGRFEYYNLKLSDSPFKGSYRDYLNHREQLKRKPRPKRPATGDSVPWNADWATLERYSGKLVRGKVKDPHPQFGIFVELCREFDGLVPRRYLEDDYEKIFRPNREVSVVIEEVGRNLNDNRPRIGLRLVKS